MFILFSKDCSICCVFNFFNLFIIGFVLFCIYLIKWWIVFLKLCCFNVVFYDGELFCEIEFFCLILNVFIFFMWMIFFGVISLICFKFVLVWWCIVVESNSLFGVVYVWCL